MTGMTAAKQQRSTRQRAAVTDLLATTPGFASAQELHRLLVERGDSVGLATVYRTMQALAEAGEVDTVRSPDGEVHYRKCRAERHHHHLVCRTCGRAVELDASAVESWVSAMASQAGFVDVQHTIELFGQCRDCVAAGAA